jgi:protein-disulfide isomerase
VGRKTIIRAVVTVAALFVGAVAILGICSGVLSFFDLEDALGGVTVVSLSDDRDDSPVVPIGDSPSTGPAGAGVTIVVFGDFQDPHTRRAYKSLDLVKAEMPSEVQLVHKHFVLAGDERALAAAMASIAADQQGAFWAYHRKLLDAPSLDEVALVSFAREVGLDVESFEVARRDHGLLIDADIELAQTLGVRGTPTLFVNGRLFEGLPDDVVGVVRAELEQADGQTYARRVEINRGLVD